MILKESQAKSSLQFLESITSQGHSFTTWTSKVSTQGLHGAKKNISVPLLAVAQHDVGGLVKTAERPHKELSWQIVT